MVYSLTEEAVVAKPRRRTTSTSTTALVAPVSVVHLISQVRPAPCCIIAFSTGMERTHRPLLALSGRRNRPQESLVGGRILQALCRPLQRRKGTRHLAPLLQPRLLLLLLVACEANLPDVPRLPAEVASDVLVALRAIRSHVTLASAMQAELVPLWGAT